MKIKFLTVITSLLVAAFMITSCLDDNNEEVEYSSNASITAFSINDIETRYTDSIHYGKDTTIVAKVTGKDYPFSINQIDRSITNVDSLPVGTDISKVVVNITADTPWLVIAAEDKDTVWTSTDSLNFENPVKFKVVAYSGVYGPAYTVKLNVHKQVPDSLQWTHISNGFDKEITKQKAVALGEKIYVFGQKSSETVITTTGINDGKGWTTPVTLSGIPANADYSSAMAWGNHLYILANEELYRSSEGTEWTKLNSSGVKLKHLIASVPSTLYAIDTENHFTESKDGTSWNQTGEVPADFPKSHLSYAVSPLVTNTTIERITIMGDNGIASDTASIVWARLTTEKNWEDYPVSENESNYCPKLANPTMIYYNNQLYAFGGPGKSYGKNIPAFSRFYESKDQGITWEAISKNVAFPGDFTGLYDQADGNYSFVIDKNNFLWIIWSKSGQVWRGRINKLGFDKQG